ncbi:MAG: hypothetical protein HFG37_12975 [Eubacterium sp.]|nr:hypothetical protein [Eubacterium sp.]
MDKFAEKFNTFDIFTMLIPGICISSLFSISLSFKYYNLWLNMGNEKYLIFIIFCYFCGILYQELGTMFDKKFLYKILYNGNPREIFLLENGHNTILNEELFFKSALKIRDYIITKLHIQISSNMTEKEEKDLNSLIFGYCLNLSENNNLTGKSEKMIVLSEMSRSLFWGCVSTIILNIYMIFNCPSHYNFYCVEILFLIIASYIFVQRKKRYERYRIRILLRTLLLCINIDN